MGRSIGQRDKPIQCWGQLKIKAVRERERLGGPKQKNQSKNIQQ